ncbi:hypothetical protein MTO96_037658 [Rhipicephalus appendiculatus]
MKTEGVRFEPFARQRTSQGTRIWTNTACSLAATTGVFLVWAYLALLQALLASSSGRTDVQRGSRRVRTEIESTCRCVHADSAIVSTPNVRNGGHICVCHDEDDLFATETGEPLSPLYVSKIVRSDSTAQENASEHRGTQLQRSGSAKL